MATKIRLMRLGKIRSPHYRIVVADARTKRDGRAIEMIGKYHPKEEPSFIEVDSDRVQHWLSVGAHPTEPVKAILKLTGDWQRHVGEPVPEGALKAAAPKADRRAVFEVAAREAAGLGGPEATSSRPRRSAPRPAEAESAREGTPSETPPTGAGEPPTAVGGVDGQDEGGGASADQPTEA